jgi:DUF4097 and DUF4098 domain-containing protein YvlB
MKTEHLKLIGLTILLVIGVLGFAQELRTDRVVVPLSNPAKPALVEASVMRGSITVKGYEGKEVIVEAKVREKSLTEENEEFEEQLAEAEERAHRRSDEHRERGKDKNQEQKAAGMKRISGAATTGLEVEEENNTVSIGAHSMKNAVDLTIQVPFSTSLKLDTNLQGDIVVEKVGGEIEVKNMNGSNTLTDVSGIVIAETMNGDVTVSLNKVTPDKPMSFSSMNGDIDVTFPADLKANVKMKTERGDIFSDFDVVLKPGLQKVEEGQKEKGKFHISFDKSIFGSINGGGPDVQFNTFNGNIYIRKKK